MSEFHQDAPLFPMADAGTAAREARATPAQAVLAAAFVAATVASAQALTAQPTPPGQTPFQWPDHIRNNKVLPRNTNSEQLRETMRGFAISLGVRCTFCHTGTEQMPLAERDFTSDANPRKNVARRMIRMVARLNRELPSFAGPTAHVTCYTCHRGSATPATIAPMPVRPPGAVPPGATPPTTPPTPTPTTPHS